VCQGGLFFVGPSPIVEYIKGFCSEISGIPLMHCFYDTVIPALSHSSRLLYSV